MPGKLVALASCSVAVWIAVATPQPVPPRAGPALEIGYAEFVGRIGVDPAGAPADRVLQTPDGDIALLPNRFEDMVGWLAGREVEVEGLVLTIARRPMLWIEAIRLVGEAGERPALRAAPVRRLAI